MSLRGGCSSRRGNLLISISVCALFIIACGGVSLIASSTSTPTPSPSPSPTLAASVTPIIFPTLTPSLTPTEPPVPAFTFTTTPAPTQTSAPQWAAQGPGDIVVPILLYHHIGFSLKEDNVYYISPELFDQQMNLLFQWGYETISVELLTRAINQGAELPPKPVILTFDDGSDTTYTTALPIMQRYRFTGVSYIVRNYIGLTHYMNADQIRALYAAGWEIGSHGLSHAELPAHPDRQEEEIVQSRRQLESLLGVPVLSFAYPFGAYNDDSLHYVHLARYIGAMGLGRESMQGSKNLFYLSRRAVSGMDDIRAFGSMLPWREETYELPALTIMP